MPSEEPFCRGIKGLCNLQESRHALVGRIFHGKKGEPYLTGMEDQLGALGLVLHCVSLRNTVDVDRAFDQFGAEDSRWPSEASPGCRSSAGTST